MDSAQFRAYVPCWRGKSLSHRRAFGCHCARIQRHTPTSVIDATAIQIRRVRRHLSRNQRHTPTHVVDAAAIDRVVVAVEPTPARVVQYSLLTCPLPPPEQLSTLSARLAALMGEGRCGSPVEVDSWQPGAFAMKPFAPRDGNVIHHNGPRRHGDTDSDLFPVSFEGLRASVPPWPVGAEGAANPVVALRRFRNPIPARVRIEGGKPSRVSIDRRGMHGGQVEVCAGPWRTSGAWWVTGLASRSPAEWSGEGWDRDEWDVTLSDGARVLFDMRAGVLAGGQRSGVDGPEWNGVGVRRTRSRSAR